MQWCHWHLRRLNTTTCDLSYTTADWFNYLSCFINSNSVDVRLIININFNTRQRRARLRILSTPTTVVCWKLSEGRSFQMTEVSVSKAWGFSWTTLLYGSESWTWYPRHVKTLDQFHLRWQRKICGIYWKDRIPNTTVLEGCEIEGIEASLIKGQLRWAGHLTRMEENRIPKAVF